MKREDLDKALGVAEELEGPLTRLAKAMRRWVRRIRARRAARKGGR